VLTANENFLKTLGYSLDEIRGQHHSMFVEAAYRQSADYRSFWEKLGRGQYDVGQYSGSARAARRSISRPATTRSSTQTASR
jgi:methyl-accepting chemotaxis protein